MKYRVGDVVTVLDDVAKVGSKDLTNPNIKIVNIPGMTVAEAETWLEPMDYTIGLSDPDWKRRYFRLDMDGLQPVSRDALTSNMDQILTIAVEGSIQELRDNRIISARWQSTDEG